MSALIFDHSASQNWIKDNDMTSIKDEVLNATNLLKNHNGPGNEFLGWVNRPTNYDVKEIEKIKVASHRIKEQSDVLVVIGIGGSYLGAKAGLHFLHHTYYNQLQNARHGWPEIYFAGYTISGEQLSDLMEVIGDRDFSINVISKSGTTTEPALAFRALKKKMHKKYGKKGSANRIYATTDPIKGALRQAANDEGYEIFDIPSDVGGRFSVLTAVGLLPLACSGVDIGEILNGAKQAILDSQNDFDENQCLRYVASRNLLYRKSKKIEMLVNYSTKVHYLAEWWKQLFGESEGKDGKGIFPASANFTTDLHSLGQYVQDGERHLFVTSLHIKNSVVDLMIDHDSENLDNLNYLSGRYLSEVNEKAAQGTLLAHIQGGVPNLSITIPKADAFHLGYLYYFFQKACAISGYVLGVNPFDQPGVEDYKNNMFRLLGKEGY